VVSFDSIWSAIRIETKPVFRVPVMKRFDSMHETSSMISWLKPQDHASFFGGDF